MTRVVDHTIFKLAIKSNLSTAEDGAALVSSLNLVDLAGSESVRHTGATGKRAVEGGKINQSLLALSRVIHALSQPGTHVSFRDSSLTRLLQTSLSGNANMSVVCCITPAERFLQETRSTLQFASRAKLVQTHAKVNEVLDDAAQLKMLERLKESSQNSSVDTEEHASIAKERDELQKMVKDLQKEIDRQMEVNSLLVSFDHYSHQFHAKRHIWYYLIALYRLDLRALEVTQVM